MTTTAQTATIYGVAHTSDRTDVNATSDFTGQPWELDEALDAVFASNHVAPAPEASALDGGHVVMESRDGGATWTEHDGPVS